MIPIDAFDGPISGSLEDLSWGAVNAGMHASIDMGVPSYDAAGSAAAAYLPAFFVATMFNLVGL